jgi:hypothetical protein
MARKVLVQMGHVAPREPGFESQTGAAGEIPEVTAIGLELYRLLRNDGRIKPTLCGGDIPDGWSGDVVLALHCDGSGLAKTSGYSLGWPTSEWGPKTKKMYVALVKAYGKIPGCPPHHADNYTANMSRYYGWSRTKADVKILIEHGFLSNPTEKAWLQKNSKQIAAAWYSALLDYFDLKPLTVPKPKTSGLLHGWLAKVSGNPWNPPNQDRNKNSGPQNPQQPSP